MLLSLNFFDKNADTEIQLEKNPVAASAGCGFLYTADRNANIYQIDHNKNILSCESGLEKITYLKASQNTQDIIAAMPQNFSYQIVVLNSTNFSSNSQNSGQPFLLQLKTKADDADLIYISSNLTYLGFANSLNEIHVFKAPYTRKSKPFAFLQVSEPVTNILITESGTLYYTTNSAINVYSLTSKTNQILQTGGVKTSFAFLNSDDNIIVCRNKTFTFFCKNGKTITHEMELVPTKVGPIGHYIYSASNAQISTSFQVIDLEYGLLVNKQKIGATVSFVDYQWGELITINNDKVVRMFQEIKNQPKIDLLCEKLRFEPALKMTQEMQLGPEIEANVHALYGDFLFGQHNFDAAIQHYIMTIGYVEPSHVIEKFVEPQHAENLAHYLAKLPRQLVTKQHTTLLFSCYTKVRATGQLDKIVDDFVKAAEKDEEPTFFVETAVDVLKRNGYRKQAMELAKAYKYYSLYLELLTEEDPPNYSEMLKYFRSIPGEQILSKICQYGTEIMENYEQGKEELIEFIVDCCTKGVQNKFKQGRTYIDPAKVSSLFLNDDRKYFDFLYKVFKSNESGLQPQTWDVLIEMALRCAQDKVLELLSHPEAKYSKEQALIYMNAFNCVEGRNYLYQQMKLYHLILQEAKPEECLEIAKKYGDEKPSLWQDGLIKVASAEGINPSFVTEYVTEVINRNVLPFQTVLQVLLKNGKHKFNTIRPIVQSVFLKEQELIKKASSDLAESQRKEAESKKTIQRITTKNFEVKKPNCDICGQPIEFESTHFFCGHSFHQSCLGDSKEFCPKCKAEYEEIASAKIERMVNARKDNVSPDDKEDGFEFLLGEISNSLFNSLDLEKGDDDEESLEKPRDFLRRLQN